MWFDYCLRSDSIPAAVSVNSIRIRISLSRCFETISLELGRDQSSINLTPVPAIDLSLFPNWTPCMKQFPNQRSIAGQLQYFPLSCLLTTGQRYWRLDAAVSGGTNTRLLIVIVFVIWVTAVSVIQSPDPTLVPALQVSKGKCHQIHSSNLQ